MSLHAGLLLPGVGIHPIKVSLQQRNRLFIVPTLLQQLQQYLEIHLIECHALELSRQYFAVKVARIVVQCHADVFALNGGGLATARSFPRFCCVHSGQHTFEQRYGAKQANQGSRER